MRCVEPPRAELECTSRWRSLRSFKRRVPRVEVHVAGARRENHDHKNEES